MSTTETAARPVEPVDAVVERLNDPAVAASLVTLLDNAELLSTLVLGLSGMIARSEMIMDSVAEGINDLRAGQEPGQGPTLADLRTVTAELVEAGPALGAVLSSSMVRPETIDLLSTLSEAATEGADVARRTDAEIGGPVSIVRALRDPDVRRGLGMVVEISRALGRRLHDSGNG